MTIKYPSVPDPGNSLDTMRATLLGLRDVVRLLVKNAQVDASLGGYATTAYVDSQINSALARLGVASKDALNAQTQITSLSASVNATLATHTGEIASLATSVNGVMSELNAGYTLTGTLATGTVTVTGARGVSSSYALAIPASLITGQIDEAQIQDGAVTVRASASSGSTSASVTLTLTGAADVLVLAGFTGPQVVSPGGTGQVIVNDGTTDHVVTDIPVATDALPVSGAILLSVTGTVTLTVRAEFTTGPTQLSGVAITAVALQR